MRFSTRSRYGVNAMFELALAYGAGAISIKDIAERQSISEAYLEQLFIRLKRAGLVESIRGSQGGYVLSAPPQQISVGAVIRALEGNIAPVDCLEGEACTLGRQACPGRMIWQDIYDGVNAVVDGITLQDMVTRFLGKEA